MVSVEVVYVPQQAPAFHMTVSLPDGATVEDAIRSANLLDSHPEVVHLSMGIFSKQVTPKTLLRHGDRVEIYRPLRLNPMDKRREKAKHELLCKK